MKQPMFTNSAWNGPKDILDEQQDIDWQMRYSEREQPEVARFLGYEEEN